MAILERTQMRTGRGIVEPLDAPAFPIGIQQAYTGLRVAFTIIPIAAGIDKFFHVLTNWDQYLAPVIAQNMVLVSAHTFMLIVGVVEIIAGLVVAAVPRIGAYIVCAWLCCIVANLLLGAGYYDVAARDFGLALGALSLGRLANGLHR